MENNQEFNAADKQREKISKKINRVIISLFVIFTVLIISMVANYYASRDIMNMAKDRLVPVVEVKEKEIVYNTPKVIYNLSGSVEEINSDFLLLRVKVPEITGKYSAEFSGPELRKVSFSEDTKFNRLKFIQIKGTSKRTIEVVDVPKEEFVLGDYVEVISGGNIAQVAEFKALQVKKLK